MQPTESGFTPSAQRGRAYGIAQGVLKRAKPRTFAPTLSQGLPSRPLLGLPLLRLIPQDIHSLADYATALGHGLCALFAKDARASATSWALAGSVGGLSLLTDYRLSAAKVVPIEVHEAADYLTAFTSLLAPFFFGYRKRQRGVAFAQIALGLGVIATSLVTDYRAAKGVRWTKGG